MNAFDKYLQQFPHYTPSVFEHAKSDLVAMTLEPGAFLLEPGQVAKHIAFVEKGLLRQYYLNEGKEVTHCFCRENSIATSYKSLVTQQESDLAIQAIEESKLLVLSYDALQRLYKKDLFWQQVGRLVAENEFVTAQNHSRFINDLSATERYTQIMKNDSVLLQRVPLNHLATYLQVTPETLSRIRARIMRT